MTEPGRARIHDHIHVGSLRAQDFLASYLGSSEQPVAFGGRDSTLADLDRWLADDARPGALVVAPAGRGKSALLCRWAQRVAASGSHRVLFAPVSVRFRTAARAHFFADLVRALQAVQRDGDDLDLDEGIGTAHAMRAAIARLLGRAIDGPPLLLLLDGLDEASDWRVEADLRLPWPPPPGLKVVCAARELAGREAGDWLRVLGWSPATSATVALPPLDTAGVGSVLHSLELRHLAQRGDVVQALFRLTGGDPLLLRLYVDMLRELAERGVPLTFLHDADLPASPPGLAGFFARWWREVRHAWGPEAERLARSARLVLEALAAALGPVPARDLARLVEPLMAPDMVADPVALASDRNLARLIIGNPATGYTLAHPRLAEFFDHGRAENWPGRYLDLGARDLTDLNSGQLAPADLSPYIRQHYGAHLERAGADVHAFAALLTPAWSRAWDASEGRLDGFLCDVDRAWRAAEASAPYTRAAGTVALRCALIYSSLSGMDLQLPDALPALFCADGIWSSSFALAHCRTVQGEYKVGALAALAPHLDEHDVAELWPDLAHLPLARAFTDTGRAHAAVIRHAVQQGFVHGQDALGVLRACPAAVLLSAGPRLLAHLGPAEREPVIDLIREHCQTDTRVGVAALLNSLPWVIGSRRRADFLQAVEHLMWDDDSDYDRVTLAWLAAAGEATQALEIALRETGDYPRANSLAAVIPWLGSNAQPAALDEWLAAYRRAGEHFSVGSMSIPHALAGPLPEPWCGKLLALLHEERPGSVGRAMALCRLAHTNPAVRTAALAAVDALADPVDQVFGLHMLITAGADPDRAAQDCAALAERAVSQLQAAIAEGRLQSISDRWQAWPDIGLYIGPVRYDSWWYKPYLRAEDHLCALAPALPPTRRRELLVSMLASTRRIADGPWQARAIAALVPHVPDSADGDSAAATVTAAMERCRAHPFAALGLAPLLVHAPSAERGPLVRDAAAAIPEEAEQRAICLAELLGVADEADRVSLQRQVIDTLFSARHLYMVENVVATVRAHLHPRELPALLAYLDDRANTARESPFSHELRDRIVLALADSRVSQAIADGIIESNRDAPLWTTRAFRIAEAVPHATAHARELAIAMAFDPDESLLGGNPYSPDSKTARGQARIQRACIQSLADQGDVARARQLAEKMLQPVDRHALQAHIARYLSEFQREQVLYDVLAHATAADTSPDHRRELLKAAVSHLAPFGHALAVRDAIHAAVTENHRLSLLVPLLPHVPVDEREAVTRTILELLDRATADTGSLGSVLLALQPLVDDIAALRPPALWPYFARYLRTATRVNRQLFLGDATTYMRIGIASLAKLIAHLGVATSACQQILDVGSWFE